VNAWKGERRGRVVAPRGRGDCVHADHRGRAVRSSRAAEAARCGPGRSTLTDCNDNPARPMDHV
jgi:hypothetical protein